MNNIQAAEIIAQKVSEAGGRAYYVGGFVRDRLLFGNDAEIKDIDLEVHGIKPELLKDILSCVGRVREEGKAFGIYSVDGPGLDVAVPRTEKATGTGHRDFEIYADPFIGAEKAAKRRDFTVNALMEDILTGEILDFYGGKEDLKNKILRHVNDESFCEDPLRVLRCAQFAARLGFKTDEKTLELCGKISLESLPKERVMGETEKALLKSEKPSVFFRELDKMNGLSYWFSELEALKGVPQPCEHHPEGDAFEHTMCVLDNCAKMREKAKKPLYFMMAGLCHDFGKAICTERESGKYHSLEHETKGLPLCENFIRRLSNGNDMRKYVLNMVKYHMKPNIMAHANSKIKSTNRMFDESVCGGELIMLSQADILPADFLPEGKKAEMNSTALKYREFLEKRLEYYNELMKKPGVTGKDLTELGIPEGKRFGELLGKAHNLRLSGLSKDEILKEIRKLAEGDVKK